MNAASGIELSADSLTERISAAAASRSVAVVAGWPSMAAATTAACCGADGMADGKCRKEVCGSVGCSVPVLLPLRAARGAGSTSEVFDRTGWNHKDGLTGYS